jgi:gamma-glutamyltranspeptidase/glutathione hydrolase
VRYTPDPLLFQLILSFGRLRARGRRRFGLQILLALVLIAPAGRLLAATPPPLRAEHAAVAADHPAASAAGVELLRAGGNAADAACATAMALGVVNPHASGLGGGGFALVYVAKEKKTYVIDFREQAPGAIKPEMYLEGGKPGGKPNRDLSRRGGLAVGVPGEVRGLEQLIKRFGKRSFADCVRPAERLASAGFAATPRLARAATAGEKSSQASDAESLKERAFLAEVFSYKSPLKPGGTVKRPALGATLRALRTKGPNAFYSGPIAAAIVGAVKEAGGVLSLEDLTGYQAIERQPIAIDYRGHHVMSMPPPSSGGIVIAEALGILSERIPDPSKIPRNSSAYLHILAETLKHGFADRARLLGDADFVQIPLERLLSHAYHQTLAARIDDNKVLPLDKYGLGGGTPPPKDGGTAHLSVIDAEGNAVALTTTINTWFGAHVIAGKTGIVLNNEMDDFSIAPGTPNTFGLVGTAQNAIAPGKRPLSSMSPTIVLDGDQVKMVVGGAGGPTIISGTLQVLLNVLDYKMDAQAASAAPRIHHQWKPEVLTLEADVAQDVIDGLTRRGHKTATRDSLTLVNVIVRTPEGLEAAAEFRSGGAPAGY